MGNYSKYTKPKRLKSIWVIIGVLLVLISFTIYYMYYNSVFLSLNVDRYSYNDMNDGASQLRRAQKRKQDHKEQYISADYSNYDNESSTSSKPVQQQPPNFTKDAKSYKPAQRRSVDDNTVPILLHDFPKSNKIFPRENILYTRRSLSYPKKLILPQIIIKGDNSNADYNGLDISFDNGKFERVIVHENKEEEKKAASRRFDYYYAFDDDEERTKPLRWSSCRRYAWHKIRSLNCNTLHEVDTLDNRSMLVNHGYWRDVYIHDKDSQEPFVMKRSRNKHDFNEATYEFIRMDAAVMERLSSSERIVDIYGYCGTAVLTEKLEYDISRKVIGGYYGRVPSHGLNDKYDVDPQNAYTPSEKLEVALDMALAIAELHGFKDGLIIHNDIQLSQFLIDRQGRLKLNDFNRAEFMLYSPSRGRYCKYRNGQAYGQYRAPEEWKVERLDEKIDVFSMGNNIYTLLTGLWNFYDVNDDQVVHKKMIEGQLPYVDPRYKTHSFAEKRLVEIMERCYIYNPEERPDIFEVVELLQKAIEENKQLYQR